MNRRGHRLIVHPPLLIAGQALTASDVSLGIGSPTAMRGITGRQRWSGDFLTTSGEVADEPTSPERDRALLERAVVARAVPTVESSDPSWGECSSS